ncbi:unnamed protein product, partial [Rotaria sp. Silwood2]
LGLTNVDYTFIQTEVLCEPTTEKYYFRECDKCKQRLPSDVLRRQTNDNVTVEDVYWMNYCLPRKNDNSNEDGKSTNSKIIMQRIKGSVSNLLDEFDDQWTKYIAHHYYIRQQISYIKKNKRRS